MHWFCISKKFISHSKFAFFLSGLPNNHITVGVLFENIRWNHFKWQKKTCWTSSFLIYHSFLKCTTTAFIWLTTRPFFYIKSISVKKGCLKSIDLSLHSQIYQLFFCQNCLCLLYSNCENGTHAKFWSLIIFSTSLFNWSWL